MSNINIQEYKQLIKKKRETPEEDECEAFHYQLQCMLHYGELPKVFLYNHSPNERFQPKGKTTGKFFAHLAKLARLGVKKGFPDYTFVFKDNKATVYFEFKTWIKDANGKTISKGYLSPDQKKFQQECLELNIPYHVVYTKEEAINILKSYIKQLYCDQ